MDDSVECRGSITIGNACLKCKRCRLELCRTITEIHQAILYIRDKFASPKYEAIAPTFPVDVGRK